MRKKVIFFARVKAEFLNKWEYYKNDIDLLKSIYPEVVVCTGYRQFARAIFSVEGGGDVFCWWWHASFPVILLSRLLNRKVFCTGAIHMFDLSGAPDFYRWPLLNRILTKGSLYLATTNVFISEDQLRSITSHLNVPRSIRIYSGLPKNFSLAPPKYLDGWAQSSSRRTITFLALCWLNKDQVKRKGIEELIRAFKILVASKNISTKLIIAGHPGDAVLSLRALVNSLELDNFVEFKLGVDAAEKSTLYKGADLLVTPSYMEGFGNASLESMSVGCPALVSRYGASVEVVGDTGLIANEITPEAIFAKLIAYTHLSIEGRLEMRTRAWIRATTLFRFSGRVIEFENLLQSINVGNRSGHR